MTTTTWRALLDEARAFPRDDGPVVAYAPNEAAFDVPFNAARSGGAEGLPVLAWTETRVYFPVSYDGVESMASAPRDPTPEGQSHVGGE